MKKILITAVIVSVLLLPNLSMAASTGLGSALGNLNSATTNSGLEKDFTTTISSIITVALSVVGTIFLILTVYAGILWMTASGKEEQVEKAGDIIKASIIGLFIVMSAYAITYFVTVGLGGSTPTSGDTTSSSGTSGSTYLGSPGCGKIGGECQAILASGKNSCTESARKAYYTGDDIGMCDSNTVCCELDEDAGGGGVKCNTMGGRCLDNCATGQTDIGDCDRSFPTSNQECCK